jgi:hypothetical protein
VELEGGVDLFVHHMTTIPSLSLADTGNETTLRTFNRDFKSADAHVTTAGLLADVSLTIEDRYRFVLGGAGLSTAVGPSSRVLTNLDGSPAELRPWTTWRLDVELPGFDYRIKHRRWMFAVGARMGVSMIQMDASIASAGQKDMLGTAPHAWSLYVRGNAEVCRRLDPVTRACVVVAPSIYDFGWLNGAQAGLRWEWGP